MLWKISSPLIYTRRHVRVPLCPGRHCLPSFLCFRRFIGTVLLHASARRGSLIIPSYDWWIAPIPVACIREIPPLFPVSIRSIHTSLSECIGRISALPRSVIHGIIPSGSVTIHSIISRFPVRLYGILPLCAVSSHGIVSRFPVCLHGIFSFRAVSSHGIVPVCTIFLHGIACLCTVSFHGIPCFCTVSFHGIPCFCTVSFHGVPCLCTVSFHGVPCLCTVSFHSISSLCTASIR